MNYNLFLRKEYELYLIYPIVAACVFLAVYMCLWQSYRFFRNRDVGPYIGNVSGDGLRTDRPDSVLLIVLGFKHTKAIFSGLWMGCTATALFFPFSRVLVDGELGDKGMDQPELFISCFIVGAVVQKRWMADSELSTPFSMALLESAFGGLVTCFLSIPMLILTILIVSGLEEVFGIEIHLISSFGNWFGSVLIAIFFGTYVGVLALGLIVFPLAFVSGFTLQHVWSVMCVKHHQTNDQLTVNSEQEGTM